MPHVPASHHRRVRLRVPSTNVQCVVLTSLVTEDPDYAILRYRYRWRIGRKLVRAVRSAALSDVLRHRLAKPGQRVSCTVTPSDGKRFGPSARAGITVR